MIENVRRGVISKLKEIFDFDIYSNEVVGDYDVPFFMVKVAGSDKIPMLGKRFRLNVNIEVLYFNDREKSDLYEFDNIIGSGLGEIYVLDRSVIADKISMDILDNKRRYCLSYTLCCEESEDWPLMETVSSKEVIKIEL